MYFGTVAIGEVSLLSFFVAAIISIFVLAYRALRKIEDEYIPFGPFLVIASIVVMFAGDGFVLKSFMDFCKFISLKIIGA